MRIEDARLCVTDDIIHTEESCPECGSKCYIQLVEILGMCSLKLEKARIRQSAVFETTPPRYL
jgi:hypothetical protein